VFCFERFHGQILVFLIPLAKYNCGFKQNVTTVNTVLNGPWLIGYRQKTVWDISAQVIRL